MTGPWPSFTTVDLGPDDDAELLRRWQVYDAEMKALIAAGGVHQDADGWWFDDATGEAIGPDPEIERPSVAGDPRPKAMTFSEAFPHLANGVGRAHKKAAKRA